MSKLKKHLYGSNHKLVTRRDFLAHGIITCSAALAWTYAGRSARAWADQQCGGNTGSTAVPFLVFDMAGGASLAANFLVGKQGGPEDLLASYNLLGWDPRAGNALYKEFGLPMSLTYSKLLEGILNNTSAEARQNFRMGSICHFAQDDSSSNKLNIASLALKAGCRGQYITNGLGIIDSTSGGNSSPVFDSVPMKPTFVSTVDNVLGATSFGGASFAEAGVDKMKVLAELGVELSAMQIPAYKSRPDGDLLSQLAPCSYEKSLTFVNGVQGLDPRLNTEAQNIYNINQNTAANDMSALAASVTMNSINGFSGPGVWTLGGCDYHDGSQTTGDTQDGLMGVEIGRAVELAHRLKKPLFFQLITDGACAAEQGTRNWVSDSGDKSMTVIGYYNPDGAPKMLRTQVGHYTDGQGVERNTLIGSEPALVGYAVLANYLNIMGRLNEFPSFAPGVFTGAGQLQSLLVFEGKS